MTSIKPEPSKYSPLKIGPRLSVWPPVVLAPMAGVTNYPYRKICYEYGAGLCISEMVSARGLVEENARTWSLTHFGPEERPRSLQIFGTDPDVLAEGIRRVRDRIDHLDINFGCPVPKVVKKGGGAMIPARPELCRRVVHAAVKAADPIPVSIKIRLGLDDDRFTFREAGRIAEGEGCAYVGLHARTVSQLYGGRARWDYIAELKSLVQIPVLGNGDIWQAPDAFRMLDGTGCDGVIIGRGCLGNPWIFRHLEQLFEGTGTPIRPSLAELVEVIHRHFELLCDFLGDERHAARMMRKFGTWYATGLRHAARLRRAFQTISNAADLDTMLEQFLDSDYMPGLPDPAAPSDYKVRSGILGQKQDEI